MEMRRWVPFFLISKTVARIFTVPYDNFPSDLISGTACPLCLSYLLPTCKCRRVWCWPALANPAACWDVTLPQPNSIFPLRRENFTKSPWRSHYRQHWKYKLLYFLYLTSLIFKPLSLKWQGRTGVSAHIWQLWLCQRSNNITFYRKLCYCSKYYDDELSIFFLSLFCSY